MSKEHEIEVLGSVYSISKSSGPREGTMVFHILSACLLCDMCPEDASLGIKGQKKTTTSNWSFQQKTSIGKGKLYVVFPAQKGL